MSVLGNALTEIGLERIVGSTSAWIKVSPAFVRHGMAGLLPSGTVLELQTDARFDDETLRRSQELRDEGSGSRSSTSAPTGLRPSARLRRHRQARRVRDRTRRDRRRARRARGHLRRAARVAHRDAQGFRLLQARRLRSLPGVFLLPTRGDGLTPDRREPTCRPRPAQRAQRPERRACRPRADDRRRCRPDSALPALHQFRLLRPARARPVDRSGARAARDRTDEAVGRADAVLEHRRQAEGADAHRARAGALLRGGRCAAPVGANPSELFTLGLFSVIDALLDTSIENALSGIPLALDIREALVRRSGPMGELLDCVTSIEIGDFRHARQIVPEAARMFTSSLEWADRAVEPLYGEIWHERGPAASALLGDRRGPP